MMKILYVVTILIAFTSTAYAIRCHVCSSTQHPDCGDPFNAGGTYVTDCSKLNGFMKTFIHKEIEDKGCLKLEIEAGGVLSTNRLCFLGDPSLANEGCEETHQQLSGAIKQKSCNVCEQDLCNSSTTTGVFATTVMCLVVLVRMMS